MYNLRVPAKKQPSQTEQPLSLFEKINIFRNITEAATEKPDFELRTNPR